MLGPRKLRLQLELFINIHQATSGLNVLFESDAFQVDSERHNPTVPFGWFVTQ